MMVWMDILTDKEMEMKRMDRRIDIFMAMDLLSLLE